MRNVCTVGHTPNVCTVGHVRNACAVGHMRNVCTDGLQQDMVDLQTCAIVALHTSVLAREGMEGKSWEMQEQQVITEMLWVRTARGLALHLGHRSRKAVQHKTSSAIRLGQVLLYEPHHNLVRHQPTRLHCLLGLSEGSRVHILTHSLLTLIDVTMQHANTVRCSRYPRAATYSLKQPLVTQNSLST
jgi:hypothetical protein